MTGADVLAVDKLFATVDPTTLNMGRRTRAPSDLYWFGTDMLGRDIYSRVMYGARVSLTVGFSVAILSSLAGLAIGLVSGMIRWADGRASFGLVPEFVRYEWGIDLAGHR